MLVLAEHTGSIVMRDSDGGQHARLYYHTFTEYPDGFKYSDLIGLPYIAVTRLYVSPQYRRQGYARDAMERMFCSNMDIRNYMIVANPDIGSELNTDQLCAFYGAFGFSKVLDIPEGTLMLATNSSICRK